MSSFASPILNALAQAVQQNGQQSVSDDGNNTSSTPPQTAIQEVVDASPPRLNAKHRVHTHMTLADKWKVTKWMNEEVARSETEKRIQSKTIFKFPQFFKSGQAANFMRAKRLWKNRENTLALAPSSGQRSDNQMSVGTVTRIGKRRVRTKALKGRGRKCAPWVLALEADLTSEFERLRKLGLKFSVNTLMLVAKNIIRDSSNELYHKEMRFGKDERLIIDLVNTDWIHRFMCRHNIVLRRQTGKLQISEEAQCVINKRVAYFLGSIAREIQSGTLAEEDVENADETHFQINMDDGRTLGFRGDEHVKYADVTSGGEGMTMLVRISGGPRSFLEVPFMIFKNKDRSYPIRGVPDTVPGVCYRTGPKGWIDGRVMKLWAEEKRALSRLPNNRKRVLFMDNCSSHKMNDELAEILTNINTEIRYFPANATDLLQPADSFVIQKIKAAWTKRWEQYKAEFLRTVGDFGSFGTKSGAIPNPGKPFFLKIAAQAVRDVNMQRDENGLTYARKAMIRCGLAKQPNGLWEIKQLFPHLQNIIAKHRVYFDGVNPDDEQ